MATLTVTLNCNLMLLATITITAITINFAFFCRMGPFRATYNYYIHQGGYVFADTFVCLLQAYAKRTLPTLAELVGVVYHEPRKKSLSYVSDQFNRVALFTLN